MSSPLSEHPIHISAITISVRPTCNKTVDHVELRTQIGGFEKEIPGKLSPGQEYREAFDVPLELSTRDELSVSMQYQSQLLGIERTPHIHITMKHDEIVKESREGAGGKRTYVKLCKYIFVTLDISSEPAADEMAHVQDHAMSFSEPSHDTLSPTSEIRRICPRFRLLIIGNTGVGRSSLIRDVFGVTDVLVSEATRGQAEIDREFVSERNDFFVLHDSLGFEAAEGIDLTRVKNFIRERRQKEDLKDRLHAIWVCLPVPYAKGRLLESGMGEFLRDRKNILGDIPIVVVLTKLDLLDSSLILALRTEGAKFRTIREVQPLLEPRRARYLQEFCTEPLLRTVGDIPHVAVSTKNGYHLEPTISQLVRKTTSEIERSIQADLPHGAVSEQQTIERNALLYIAKKALPADMEAQVGLTIEIVKNRYWANLGAGFRLSGEKVKEYLLIIHRDIIRVWNFDDPEMALQSDWFKEALLDTSGPISGGEGAPAGSMASVLSPLIADPVSVVVAFPIVGIIALSKWSSESAQTVAKRSMAYVTDLIYVMKILFILAPHGSVTARDVALAVDIYTRSGYRRRIHLDVSDFYASGALVGPSAVADKLEVLVRQYDITDEEVLRMQSQMRVPPVPPVPDIPLYG